MAKDKRGYVVLGVMLLAGGYLVYDTFIKDRGEDKATQPPPPDISPSAPTPLPKKTTPIPVYPFGYGNTHPDFQRLQAILGVKQDGIFGSKSLAAIQKWVPGITSSVKFWSLNDLNNFGYTLLEKMGKGIWQTNINPY